MRIRNCVAAFTCLLAPGVGTVALAGEAEDNVKEQVAALKELTKILKGVADNEKATTALPQLQKLGEQKQELSEKLLGMKLTDDEDKALMAMGNEVNGAAREVANALKNAIKNAPDKKEELVAFGRKMAAYKGKTEGPMAPRLFAQYLRTMVGTAVKD